MPYIGDVRIDNNKYPGVITYDRLKDIKEFEVWDGQRWVSNAETLTFPVFIYEINRNSK